MAGRRPLNGTRMKPNGLLPELDDWYFRESIRLSMIGVCINATQIKRDVLTLFRDTMAGNRKYNIALDSNEISQYAEHV